MTHHTVKADALDDVRHSLLSIAKIAVKHGHSEAVLRKWMKSEGVSRKGQRAARGMKAFASAEALSTDHVRIGLRLLRRRGALEKTDFARALGVSAIRLGLMENGRHDFTLKEMITIEAVLGEPVISVLPSCGKTDLPRPTTH